MTFKILFVCTGNICRSPTAHGIFRDLVKNHELQSLVDVDSAGTHGYHIGEGPDHRAVEIAKLKGTDLSTLRARKLEGRDFKDFDIIIAMDQGHMDIMHAMQPEGSTASLKMFLEFSPVNEMRDVPDPYYGSMKDFENVYDLCLEACHGLLNYTKNEIV